jgi:hypothetical protein
MSHSNLGDREISVISIASEEEDSRNSSAEDVDVRPAVQEIVYRHPQTG